MEPEETKERSARDELWASLRALRLEIERLAGGDYDGTERQRQIIALLARIVAAEMDFRDRDAEEPAADAMGD